MRILLFAKRNAKEILRDPLNLGFGIGFPLVVLFLLSAIQANIPMELFRLEQLTPGVCVFGLSFISLFSGQLVAKDRGSSFMLRLLVSPLRAGEFILGYMLPLLPIAVAQSIVCYGAALLLGLPFSWNILLSLAALLPAAILFIGIGLLAGSLLTDKQVGGFCGALLTNLSAWLSGTWFDVRLVGGVFEKIAYALPFARAVDAARAALSGDAANIFPDLGWVLAYGLGICCIAILVVSHQLRHRK